MIRSILSVLFLFLTITIFAQSVTQKLQVSFSAFEKDAQLKNGISSLYVIDANTGQVVFEKNSRTGLAPASTQKIITSVTAFELLGKDYRYKTDFGYNKNDKSQIMIIPSGDPTLGSWRWQKTSVELLISKLHYLMSENKMELIKSIAVDSSKWDAENIPDGWIWQDIGNYYGTGAQKFNFRENQFDIILQSGKSIGDSVKIVSVIPEEFRPFQNWLVSKLVSAGIGTGDNAYVYLPNDGSNNFMIRGSIPINENNFSISASIINPPGAFYYSLLNRFQKKNSNNEPEFSSGIVFKNSFLSEQFVNMYNHYSPGLDSIIYWFNKKSINLYGEALIKTLAFEKKGVGSTEEGIKFVKEFWKENKLDADELKIVDGSGLSPLNKVTTHAQVQILKFAKSKDWYPLFLNSFPEYNGMMMKSGTISGAKGFCGYHKAKNGKEYIFSFLVNNYNGSPSTLVNKMYKVLNNLK